MARYKVQGPDGRTYTIEGPDGASQDEILQAAQSLAVAGSVPSGQQVTNSNASRRTPFVQRGDPDIARWRNPTGNGFENFWSGLGKTFYDTGRGIGQLAGAVSEQDIADSRRRDAPLMNTGAGVLGGVAGYAAQMIGPGVIAGGLAKGAQGANLARAAAGANELRGLNAVANTANAVRSAAMPTSLAGNMAQGAALGYVQPVVGDESRLQNAAVGTAAGGLGYMAPGVIKGAKAALIDPLTDKGNERIIARTLRQFAQNTDNLANPTAPDLPGYQPTLAEATLDPGIAQFQRAMLNSSDQLRGLESVAQSRNNLARVNALEGLAPTVADATAARSTATAGLYDAARTGVAQVDDAFKALMQRPSIKEGLQRARQFAAEAGDTLPKKPTEYTGAHLQYIDQALSDQIGKAVNAGEKGHAAKLIETQSELRAWMEQSIPEYNQAQAAYREASRPVNQAQIAEQIRGRAFSNSTDLTNGVPIIRPDSAKGAIRDLGKTAKAAGVKGDPNAIMTADQLASLDAVRNSLDRYTFAQNAGQVRGQSATAANLASMNALNQLGLPAAIRDFGPVTRIAGVLDKAMKATGVPERLNDKLAEVILNPQEAQRVLAALPENDKRLLGKAMQFLISQQTSARIGMSAAQARD